MAPFASVGTARELEMGSVPAAAALSEAAGAMLKFCPGLLIVGEAEAAAGEWATGDKAVLGGITELEVLAEGVTSTTVSSVPLVPDVGPNPTGISVVPGSKIAEEVDSESGEGDASSVCFESRDLVNKA